jgi:hypothetical protein
MLVALALVGSAWLAYATTAPRGVASYPTTPEIRVKGKGYCGDKKSQSHFQFDVRRDKHNQLKGGLHTEVGKSQLAFQGQQLTSLTLNGNTVTFSINGMIHGPHNKDKSTYTADVTATDGNPDTIAITVHNSSVIYSNACTVQGGFIVIQNTH